jgi:hypothetical protein
MKMESGVVIMRNYCIGIGYVQMFDAPFHVIGKNEKMWAGNVCRDLRTRYVIVLNRENAHVIFRVDIVCSSHVETDRIRVLNHLSKSIITTGQCM